MTIHYLESAADPRVADYTQLTDVHLRKLREPAEGMYIAESSRVLRRALAAGHQPRSFFLAEKWLEDLRDVLDAYPQVPAFIGSADLLEDITGFHLHRGAMAAMQRPAPGQGISREAILRPLPPEPKEKPRPVSHDGHGHGGHH